MSVKVETEQIPPYEPDKDNQIKNECESVELTPELWVDVHKAAPVLGVTVPQLYRAVRDDLCPIRFVRVGKKLLRFSAIDLGLVQDSVAIAPSREEKL